MAVPKFYTVPVWSEASDRCKSMILDLLRQRIVVRLGKGVHKFESVERMFASVGIGHVAWQSVSVRNVRMFSAGKELASDEPMFYMSHHSFARLVRRMSRVRLVQNSLTAVEREGAPRLLLIVS